MREAEFRAWLDNRSWNGVPLSKGANGTRMSWLRAVERALAQLGFEERDLDEVHEGGRWPDLLKALAAINRNWRSNEAASRRISPEATDPTGQIGNARAVARLYGYFADGHDPDYRTAGFVDEVDREALEELKKRFLSAFPGFENGGGFAGRNLYHEKVDDRRRELIATIRARLDAQSGSPDETAGAAILDLLIENVPILGFPELRNKVLAIRRRHPGELERSTGALARSKGDPINAAMAFLDDAWPLIVEGTEDNKPFRESRALPTVIQALVRPEEAIAINDYQRYTNLASALLGRSFFANKRLSPSEYSAVLSVAKQILSEMHEWGWSPRDLWDVQGFIWTTCATKLSADSAASLPAPAATAEEPASEAGPYWFVGASFGRTHDQLDRFLKGGFWEISEPTPRQREQVLSMEPGQRIAIKATFVRKLNLPFDNRGRPVSVMPIKAIGTITANSGNGERVSVAWEPDYHSREWYHYTYQPTIWEVYPDKEMARRLIAFAFQGAEQDYEWFLANLSNWKDLAVADDAGDENRPDPRRRDPQNIILFGPPGTGKTYSTMSEAVRLCLGLDTRHPLVSEPDRRGELRAEYERLRTLGQIAFVTFHQSFAYEDFIEGREPKPIKGSAGFELASRDGLFTKFARKAGESEEEHVLIIDEINRANVSKVFGELITLIERDKRRGMDHAVMLRLPYSQDEFSVPANLHIVGTMNTADRSIALLDTALRRRFTFREVPPQPELLSGEVDGVPLRRVLEAMNDRIEYLIDRDHRIGHAFFMGEGGKDRQAIDRTMLDRVIPLLQEYFFEDWSRVAAVLGEREGKGGGFLDCRKIKDPTGKGGEDRLSWSVRSAFADDAYRKLIGRGAGAGGSADEAGAGLELETGPE